VAGHADARAATPAWSAQPGAWAARQFPTPTYTIMDECAHMQEGEFSACGTV
jgi:hypothetical protein